MKRKRKSSSLSTHYSEVNHRTPKAVLSYGPNIGHIPHIQTLFFLAETHVATEKRDVYLQQQQDGTIGFYAGSISGYRSNHLNSPFLACYSYLSLSTAGMGDYR
ncbi:hypothetical protein R6Q59_029516 [Mikania micrantha]